MGILRKISFIIAMMLLTFNAFSQEKQNLLCYYVQQNQPEEVEHLLNRGADPNDFDESGYTAVMYAADIGNMQIVKMLMDAGANPNFNPLYDSEPPALHAAVLKKNPELVDLLLLYDITDVNFTDSVGRTALFQAVYYGDKECADVLLFHGANPESGSVKYTPLQTAAYFNDTAMIKILLKNGANINTVKNNRTAFSIAIERKKIEAAQLLKDNGANINLGKTDIWAAAYSNPQCLDLLKSAGMDLNQTDSNGYSLKDIAIFRENTENIKKLNELGVKSNKSMIFRRFSISETNEVAKYEGRIGLQFGIHENKTNTALYLGFSGRPFYKPTLHKVDENYYYQLREKLKFFQVTIEKRFAIQKSNIFESGAYLAYQFAGGKGKFDGATDDIEPKSQIFHVPSAGVYFRYAFVGMSVGYKYYAYKDAIEAPKNVVSFAFDFYLSRKLKSYNITKI